MDAGRWIVGSLIVGACLLGCDDGEDGFGSGGDGLPGADDGSDGDGGDETDTGNWDVPRCEAFQIEGDALSMLSAGLMAECEGDDKRVQGGAVHRASAVVCENGGAVCKEDADCSDGQACLCHAGFTTGGAPSSWQAVLGQTICYAATCLTDADCEGDTLCMLDECAAEPGLHCQTAGDDCSGDADCDAGKRCTYSADDSKWVCAGEDTCG